MRDFVEFRPICGLAAGWLLTGCATHVNPYFDPAKPHHTAQGFRNNYIGEVAKPLSALLKWRIEALRAGLPAAAREPTPVAVPELARLKDNRSAASVTWIGHASTLVQCGASTC